MIAVLIAGSVAMILSLFGTRWLIAIFDSLGKGQPILGSEDHGPVHHMKKQGTATMGGIAIIFAAFIGWLVAHLRGGIALSDQAMIMWAGVGVLSLMGFLDDFLKVRKSHNRGILWKKKGYITFAMVIGLMWWLLAGTGISETLSFTRSDFPGWNLSPVLWVVWTAIMVWATTNAVNDLLLHFQPYFIWLLRSNRHKPSVFMKHPASPEHQFFDVLPIKLCHPPDSFVNRLDSPALHSRLFKFAHRASDLNDSSYVLPAINCVVNHHGKVAVFTA